MWNQKSGQPGMVTFYWIVSKKCSWVLWQYMQRSGQASILMKVCPQNLVQRLETELRVDGHCIGQVVTFYWIGQNYSLLEQTLDILIKNLMKISKVDMTVDS